MDKIKLYHNTRFSNLANILKMGVMTTNNPHKEGHGDMLWFTVSDDYGSDVRISIDVPQEDFDNGRFEFVNKIHVVTLQNVSISEYNFVIDSFCPIYLNSIGAYYTGFKGETLIRLANNKPNGVVEEMVFKGFYEEYIKQDKNIQVILDYIRNNSNVINETKNMKKTIKLNESQLKNIVRESLKKMMLKEERLTSWSTYCPAERLDYNEENNDLDELMFKQYRIEFAGQGWSEPSQGQYGWGAGYPGVSDIENIKVVFDDGLGEAINRINTVNPELASAIKDNFEDWVISIQNGAEELEWEGEEPYED